MGSEMCIRDRCFTSRQSALDLVERQEEEEFPTFSCQSLECSLFLFVCQLSSISTVSNFLKNDTQEKSVLLANDGRVKYHRSI